MFIDMVMRRMMALMGSVFCLMIFAHISYLFLLQKRLCKHASCPKRWINTWASVPDLIFDIEEFGCLESFDEDRAAVVTKLELLMRSVLEKREASCVNIFRLWLDPDTYWPHTQAVVDCIGDVMKLWLLECLVEMGTCEKLNLSTGLFFTCASLIHLQLLFSTSEDHEFVAIEPNSVNLPCLETLNLGSVTMSDDSFKMLLLGCPMLEDLVLDNCYIDIIEICSKTLKKLVIQNPYGVMRYRISTPNLLHLDIFVHVIDILLLNMALLVHASIYIPDWYVGYFYITTGPKLIHSLSNVESLELKFDYLKRTVMGERTIEKRIEKFQYKKSEDMLPPGDTPAMCCHHGLINLINCQNTYVNRKDNEKIYFIFMPRVLKKEFSNCPVFNNLKCLELLDWRSDEFDHVLVFLLQSPKLQELTLAQSCIRNMKYLDEEITQEGLEGALVQREFLKTVRIVEFKNDRFVDQLINKLLVHVKIIGEIDIGPCPW